MHPPLNRLRFLMQDVQNPVCFNVMVGIRNVKDVLILTAVGLNLGVRTKDAAENQELGQAVQIVFDL